MDEKKLKRFKEIAESKQDFAIRTLEGNTNGYDGVDGAKSVDLLCNIIMFLITEIEYNHYGGVRWSGRRTTEDRLIVNINENHEDCYDGYKRLKRLHPDAKMPKGHEEVMVTFYGPIYDNDGRLLPKFKALERHGSGQGDAMDERKKIQLEAFITLREGMIAENTKRDSLGQSVAYAEIAFFALADKIQELR